MVQFEIMIIELNVFSIFYLSLNSAKMKQMWGLLACKDFAPILNNFQYFWRKIKCLLLVYFRSASFCMAKRGCLERGNLLVMTTGLCLRETLGTNSFWRKLWPRCHMIHWWWRMFRMNYRNKIWLMERCEFIHDSWEF